MKGGAGVVVALAAGCGPDELLNAASPWVPRRWPVHVEKTGWGAALAAGPGCTIDGSLACFGCPVADPWGTPKGRLQAGDILDRYRRYGDHVMQLAAGPYAVADLEQGRIAAALNGIIPLFIGRGRRTVIGTQREMVALISGNENAEAVPSGSWVSVTGDVVNIAAFHVSESLPLMSLRGLEKEIHSHVLRAGPLRHITAAPLGAVDGRIDVYRAGGALLASPRLSSYGDAGGRDGIVATVRADIQRLWWQAALSGRALFVPALERPALDSFSLVAAPQ